MQQGVQTEATCKIQQYLELLANNVASIYTGLNNSTPKNVHAFRIQLQSVYKKKARSSWINSLSKEEQYQTAYFVDTGYQIGMNFGSVGF